MYARYRIWWHAAFWVSFYVYRSLMLGYQSEGSFLPIFAVGLVELPLYWLVTYPLLYVLIPKYLTEGKYIRVGVYLLGLVIMAGVLRALAQEFLIWPWLSTKPDSVSIKWHDFLLMVFHGCFFITSASGIAMATKFIKDWYLNYEAKQRLERETTAVELQYLRAQVNPHFLSSTLTALHQLTLKQSRKSPEVVMRLSQLLHYVLYDSNQERVPLSKEMEYLQNYVELERLRYDEQLTVSFMTKGHLQTTLITPFLLQPFVENAFRRLPQKKDDISWLSIELVLNTTELTLKIECNKAHNTPLMNSLALTNAKQRLAMLYPQRHTLRMVEEAETFLTVLKIETQFVDTLLSY